MRLRLRRQKNTINPAATAPLTLTPDAIPLTAALLMPLLWYVYVLLELELELLMPGVEKLTGVGVEKLREVGVDKSMDDAEERWDDSGAKEAPVKRDGALLEMAVM